MAMEGGRNQGPWPPRRGRLLRRAPSQPRNPRLARMHLGSSARAHASASAISSDFDAMHAHVPLGLGPLVRRLLLRETAHAREHTVMLSLMHSLTRTTSSTSSSSKTTNSGLFSPPPLSPSPSPTTSQRARAVPVWSLCACRGVCVYTKLI